jgi:hypothetical protein
VHLTSGSGLVVPDGSTTKTFVIAGAAPEIAFAIDGEPRPGSEIVLLGSQQWESCVWSAPPNEDDPPPSCPPDRIHGIVRVGTELRLDASRRARAALANGTIYGAVEPRSPTKEECGGSKFKLVLCGSAPALAAAGRPKECRDDNVFQGTCGMYDSQGKSWCSQYHELLYIHGLSSAYFALLVVVVCASVKVLQDLDVDSVPKPSGDGSSAAVAVRSSFRAALRPQLLSPDDGGQNLGLILQQARQQSSADTLSVYLWLCGTCIAEIVYYRVHDDYDRWYQYVLEGLGWLCQILIVFRGITLYLSRRSHADARPEARERHAKLRNYVSAYFAVLIIVRAILKSFTDRPWMYAEEHELIKTAYIIVTYIFGVVPCALVVLYLVVSTVLKSFKRAGSTALQGVELVGDRARALSTTLLTSSQDMEQAQNPVSADDSGADEPDAESDDAASGSEAMRNSVRRYHSWVKVVVLEGCLSGLMQGVRKVLEGTSQPAGCIACDCHGSDFESNDASDDYPMY